MITKISIDRSYVFTPSTHLIVRATINGNPSIQTLSEAITFAVSKYEILNCRIMQDCSGECFYVPKETPAHPHIEIRENISNAQHFVNEQEKIPFDLEAGELQRYIIEYDDECIVLNIVQHPLTGDQTSAMILLDTIMDYTYRLANGEKIILSDSDIVPVKVFNQHYLESQVSLNPLTEEAVKNINDKWSEEDTLFTLDEAKSLYNNYWAERKSNVATATINGETLKNLEEACKEHNVTLGALILTIVTSSLARKSTLNISTNLRTNEYKGLGNYSGLIRINSLYDDKLDIWKNTARIQQLMAWKSIDKAQLLADLLFRGSFSNTLIDSTYFQLMNRFENQIVHEYNTLTDFNQKPFCFHNLERKTLKESYGTYSIEKLNYFSPLAPNSDCSMSIMITNGNLAITMLYSESSANYGFIFGDLIVNLNSLGKYKANSECYLKLAAM